MVDLFFVTKPKCVFFCLVLPCFLWYFCWKYCFFFFLNAILAFLLFVHRRVAKNSLRLPLASLCT